MIEPTSPNQSKFSTGWVAPNGDFFPCPISYHAVIGDSILERYFPQVKEPILDVHGFLYDAGYLHIGGYLKMFGKGKWVEPRIAGCCDIDTTATDEQLNTVLEIAKTYGENDVCYGNLMEFYVEESNWKKWAENKTPTPA